MRDIFSQLSKLLLSTATYYWNICEAYISYFFGTATYLYFADWDFAEYDICFQVKIHHTERFHRPLSIPNLSRPHTAAWDFIKLVKLQCKPMFYNIMLLLLIFLNEDRLEKNSL